MVRLVRAIMFSFFGAFFCAAGVNVQIAQFAGVDVASAPLDAPHPALSFDYATEAFEENDPKAEVENRSRHPFVFLLALSDLLDEPAPHICPFVIAEGSIVAPKAGRLIRPYVPRGPPAIG